MASQLRLSSRYNAYEQEVFIRNLSQCVDNVFSYFNQNRHSIETNVRPESLRHIKKVRELWNTNKHRIDYKLQKELTREPFCRKEEHIKTHSVCKYKKDYYWLQSKLATEKEDSDLYSKLKVLSTISSANFDITWLVAIDGVLCLHILFYETSINKFCGQWCLYFEYLSELWRYIEHGYFNTLPGNCHYQEVCNEFSNYFIDRSGPCLETSWISSPSASRAPNRSSANTNGPIKPTKADPAGDTKRYITQLDIRSNVSTSKPKLDHLLTDDFHQRDHSQRPATASVVRAKEHTTKTRPKTARPKTDYASVEYADNLLDQVLSKNKEMEEENRRLQMENRELKKDKSALLDQLSSGMNRQLNRDESDLENINVKARPMKISEDYEIFCSQQWLDAKDKLDRDGSLDEKGRCELLCNIMEKCYEKANESYDIVKGNVVDITKDPFSASNSTKTKVRKTGTTLGRDLEVSLSKALRENADRTRFQDMAQDFEKQLQTQYVLMPRRSKSIRNFIENSLSLSWKMILQQPPMRFNSKSLRDRPYDKEKAEPHFGSGDPNRPGALIEYYVQPALFHGDKLMRKARVIVAAGVEMRSRSDRAPADRAKRSKSAGTARNIARSGSTRPASGVSSRSVYDRGTARTTYSLRHSRSRKKRLHIYNRQLPRTSKSITNFIHFCPSLSWKMILQQPPMRFDSKSLRNRPFDKEKAEPHFGSGDPNRPGALIEYYVQPALFHGDKLMRKARVIVAAGVEMRSRSDRAPADRAKRSKSAGATLRSSATLDRPSASHPISSRSHIATRMTQTQYHWSGFSGQY